MPNLTEDLRFAVRLLLKNRGFTLVSVLTLALAIGANTAIFSVVHGVLLRPLPYPESEQLVQVLRREPDGRTSSHSVAHYAWLSTQAPVFSHVTGYEPVPSGFNLVGDGLPERLSGVRVTGTFFDTLGVRPQLGRTFLPEEDVPGSGATAVISHGVWQRRFGGAPDVIGRSLTLNDTPYTVVGVAPEGFRFPEGAQLWTPLRLELTNEDSANYLLVTARVKPGVSREAVDASLATLSERMRAQLPLHMEPKQSFSVEDLRVFLAGDLRLALWVLLGAVALVLLIACVNLANLQLARAAARQRELVVRAALGAAPGRLVRQLLTESLLLALLGGAAGLLCAQWGLELLLAAIPAAQLGTMPYLRDLPLDARVLAFTFGVSVLTGVLFGLAPAVVATRPDLQGAMKGQARSVAGGTRGRLRQALVVGEVALALVLLVGAGLLLKSLTRMMAVDPGFDRENLVLMDVLPPPGKYEDDRPLSELHTRLLSRAEALPGVTGAAFTSKLPLSGRGNTIRYVVEGRPPPEPGHESEAHIRSITSNYFRTLSVPLVRGRTFAATDDVDAPEVVIINETLAAKLFPGQDPLGQRVRFTFNSEQKPREIVGVVGDERMAGLDSEPTPIVYTPDAQNASTRAILVLRMKPGAVSVASTLRAELRAEDGDLVLSDARTMEEMVETSPWLFLRRYPTLVVGVFAAVALLLAMVGVYGVMAYSLSQRARELAIRMALGAKRRDVMTMVVRQGASMALLGVGLGLMGSLALSRVLQRVLFGVSAADPLVLIGGAAVLVLMAVLASWLPALRASRVDPASALR